MRARHTPRKASRQASGPSLKGLFNAARYLFGMAVFLGIALFFFWLADWHVYAQILVGGRETQAVVVDENESWSRWPHESTVEARKTYIVFLEYTDENGKTQGVAWDSSYDLFKNAHYGKQVPIRYLPGAPGMILPDGELYDALVDGEYGGAGFFGVMALLPIFVFPALAWWQRRRGDPPW